jgi:hypothetical protein
MVRTRIMSTLSQCYNASNSASKTAPRMFPMYHSIPPFRESRHPRLLRSSPWTNAITTSASGSFPSRSFMSTYPVVARISMVTIGITSHRITYHCEFQLSNVIFKIQGVLWMTFVSLGGPIEKGFREVGEERRLQIFANPALVAVRQM